VIELARSGTKVAELVATFGMSDVTIYSCLRKEAARSDRSAREPPHVRVADDRRWRQRQGAVVFMGHESINITLDRYGHPFPGSEEESAGLLDAYLERANTKARLAAVGG
jgi:hypothetical protein